jgi:hypothetical protein
MRAACGNEGPDGPAPKGTIMNDALGMYLVIKAEHALRLAENAERERRRSYPRATSNPRRRGVGALRWVQRLRRATVLS